MESSAIARYNPQKSSKRDFPGSSWSYVEPEVIEIAIPPPSAERSSKSKAKALKQKEVVYHEIIDVDMDEDWNDVVLIEGKVESNKKRKGAKGISLGPRSAEQGSTTKKDYGKGVSQMPSVGPGLQNFLDLDDYESDDDYVDKMDIPTGIEAPIPWMTDKFQMKKKSNVRGAASTYYGSYANKSLKNLPFVETPQKIQLQNMAYNYMHDQVAPPMKTRHTGSCIAPQVAGGISAKFFQLPLNKVGTSSSMAKAVDNEDVLKRYESFKKFDTVVDFSDHHYARQSSGSKQQPPKNWAKKIQDEWRILEKNLPDTIFVRAYESRMDLLRAVIIGAEGTPYQDGLFFFDICFSSSYPNSPPLVHYHSGGHRINPNLYESGFVCLSLLYTMSGDPREGWIPGTSTMLQVLVSIQGLILNTKPFWNEPGHACWSGSALGEKSSIRYNENTLILSLKTMVYTMNKPPKNFEDLVTGHFRNRVRDILMACKAYTEGVQVGCLVRGGVQDVDEGNDSCSAKFKDDVAACVKMLVVAFKNIGAKEAEEFIGLSEKKSRPSRAVAPPRLHSPAHAHAPPPVSF